jgi:hypothetical protein
LYFLLALLVGGSLVGTLAMLGVVAVWRRREQRSGRRSPLPRSLLRAPGESLREQIDDVRWDLAMYLGIGMLPIPLGVALYMFTWLSKGAPPTVLENVLYALVVVAMQAGIAWKLWGALARLRPLRLGYDAEVAVGQELHDLAPLGYRVFHDLPVEDRQFNVDHVLVGPGGVFAVETKGRMKPHERTNGSEPWEVVYDGSSLQFPGWTEKKPLKQAQAVADWLRDWLSEAVGERVAAQPVVVLPGWFVKRTSGDGIPVLAVRQFKGFLSRMRPSLNDQLIQRISHQLEQRCRDVEPGSYRNDGKRRED